MRWFGLKAAAVRVLNEEFLFARSELDEDLLDRCVSAGGNQYDVALQYFIARSVEVDPLALWVAKKLSVMTTNPAAMSNRLNALS